MIAIVSPSKTMKEENRKIRTTSPKFISETDILAEELKNYSISDLERLMGISEDLAILNYERFQNYSHAAEYPALFLFRGDVFRGIDADTLTQEEIQYLNKHLRILSGLYGVLKPLDRMKPYRLEMGTKLKNIRGKDLYSFWGDQIKLLLEKESKDQILINLASKEYAKAARLHESKLIVYDVEFREKKNGAYPIIAFYAKIARGEMARFMAKNKVQRIDQLKEFNYSGYEYNATLSSEKTLIFTRG
ncbi:peroxide stress protein YaaA [Proteiniclasticum ruminis]|uniref:UPF0246 protein SAMN04488695_101663 n=1 Tax=Proteiniclasticum ruminis TaxID=398199 RepID=A0A1I4YLG4_9CLOT|nr:peroxide stress protein YaaA [Proteiniclasticum ruminis]SFN38827.1 hypothetical protein SAMN04488695_101663 [Proteiniclasticum ruminis]